MPLNPYEVAVDNVGAIRRLRLECPALAGVDPNSILSDLQSKVRAAYCALEQVFLRRIDELEEAVFRGAYRIMEAQLRFSNKLHLLGRYWFAISRKDEGLYILDRKSVETILRHYGKRQHELWSPLEMTIWMLTARLPFENTTAHDAFLAKQPLTVPWERSRYIKEVPNAFEAEVCLYESDAHTSNTLCERRGYFLIAACPAEIGEEVMREVDIVRPQLERGFERGIASWSPYIKLMKKAGDLVSSSPAARLIGQAVGEASVVIIERLAHMD
jgi:hypothetical protein